jgi:addiction module RelE/StbE family toxin
VVRVVWAEPAIADLEEVYGFIARDSRKYARLTIERITSVVQRLADFPELGEVLREFAHRGYRQIVVGSYRVIYRADSERDRLLILAVVHSRRDLPPVLENR